MADLSIKPCNRDSYASNIISCLSPSASFVIRQTNWPFVLVHNNSLPQINPLMIYLLKNSSLFLIEIVSSPPLEIITDPNGGVLIVWGRLCEFQYRINNICPVAGA